MKPMRHCRKQVGLSSNSHLLAAKVKVAVQHRIHKLAALTTVFPGNGNPALTGEKGHQLVVRCKSRESVKQNIGNARLVFESNRRPAHLFADGYRPASRAHSPDMFKRDAAQRGRREFLGNVAVQRSGQVGQEERVETERFEYVSELIDVSRADMAAGKYIDATGEPCIDEGCLNQFLDHARHRCRPSIDRKSTRLNSSHL